MADLVDVDVAADLVSVLKGQSWLYCPILSTDPRAGANRDRASLGRHPDRALQSPSFCRIAGGFAIMPLPFFGRSAAHP
jgi:hypothetical protein